MLRVRAIAVCLLTLFACLGAACSGGNANKPALTATAQAGGPSATPGTNQASPTARSATNIPSSAAFPSRCSALATNADVDALAARHLEPLADSVAVTSGTTSQLVCRYQGSGTGGDTAIIIIAAGYADAGQAREEDAILRRVAQDKGGVFTPLRGLGDEAYSFEYPTVTGAAARQGSRSVSIGVGKGLGAPTSDELNVLLRVLLGKLGN